MILAANDDPGALAISTIAASLSRADLTERAVTWFGSLPAGQREVWADKVGRFGDVGNGPAPRPERIIALLAYEAAFPQVRED